MNSGTATAPVTHFGSINLDAVRAMLASATIPPDTGGPTFAPNGPDPYQGQFTVELDVTSAGSTLTGIDRKVLTAMPADASLRAGFPKALGTGGEAPPRYADLNGDGVQELLVPAEDGQLHAYEPNGTELAGWPFITPVQASALGHESALSGLPQVREPLRGLAVADLDHTGVQDVVVTAGTDLFVIRPDGTLRPGFPVSVDPALCVGTDQSQPNHHRKCGFIASPALGHLVANDPKLDIVVPGLDGHLYAWDSAGHLLPQFANGASPKVDLSDPAVPLASRQFTESITNPTLRDLNGDGIDDIVVASNEAYGAASPTPNDVRGGVSGAFADALSNIGGSSRLYAIDGHTGAFLPGWPVKLNGAIQSTLPFIGPGHDSSTLTLSGSPVVVASTTGGVVSEFNPDGTLLRGIQQSAFGPASNATDRTGVFNLFEYASIGDVLGTGQPDVVKYGITLGAVANLALSGQNVPYNHLIGAYDAGTGAPLPAFPTITDDYQFLSSSTIAQVVAPTVPGSTGQQIIAGTGLGLLHAYDGATGKDVSGFPKVTGGWLFAPAALSDDHRMAAITREGFLFEWSTDLVATTCQTQWPGFRHDPHNSGDYNTDGTAPGAPLDMKLNGRAVSFASPGDDNYCGTATSYRVTVDGVPVAATGPVVGPRASATLLLPTAPSPGSVISVLAVDKAGNTGTAARLTVPSGPSPSASPTASASSSSPAATPTPTGTASAAPSSSASPTGSASPPASPSASPSPSPSGTSTGPAGLFHPLVPTRVLDTRPANDPVVAGVDRVVHLSGLGGIPETGVSAVVLSVTVPLPQADGDLQVYPVGDRPANRTSNLNWPAHRTIANLVTAPLGQGGSVELSVSQASAHAVVDVIGWYGDGSDSGGTRYTALTPSRVLETGTGDGRLRAGTDQTLLLRGRGGVPSSADVSSVAVTVTALGTDGPADLQVYPTGNRPTQRTSNLNLVKGQTAAVLVNATLGGDGSITLSLSNSSARVVVDVVGYYSAAGSRFVALSPRRVLDRAMVSAGGDSSVILGGTNGIPGDATGVLVNTTGVDSTAPLDLQVYPTGAKPAERTSVLNLEPGQAVADLVASGLQQGALSLSVSQGRTSVILDLAGYFSAT
ncbi:MAG: VCBS repeat-containing protein [Actinomycetota bacterium]|nr:VCBS repeat-containing protein [Actinomycetota bacterium]